MIYLDHAASTPVLPQVKEKLLEVLDIYGNPSSLHSEGQKAKEIITEAKEIISSKLNCSPDEIFFTSGATMSNNLIIQGFEDDTVISAIEHEDIQMLKQNYVFRSVPVNSNGEIIYEKLKEIVEWNSSPRLFSIQGANGEIGTIQNLAKISDCIHSHSNKYFHTDITQYIPYFPVDVKKLNIDALSMSAQKIGGLKGTGLLYISKELQSHCSPIIFGKQGYIGGTENVPGIACLGKAFECLDYDNTELIKKRDMLINGLDGELIGPLDRLPNNVCMKFNGIDSESLVILLNEFGVCCSAGSACSSGNAEPSHVLKAIGLSDEEAKSCVRFTLGNNTEQEIEEAIKIINNTVHLLNRI